MTTLLVIISYILVLVLGGFLGVVIFVDKRNMGDIMVKDSNDQLCEIQFKPGTTLAIVDMEYIVLHMKRTNA